MQGGVQKGMHKGREHGGGLQNGDGIRGCTGGFCSWGGCKKVLQHKVAIGCGARRGA